MVAESHAVADELGTDADVRHAMIIPRGGGGLYSEPHTRRDPQIRRAPNSAGLYDVLDLILDKGIVVDAFVRVSLVGIELLTVDLRVVIASVDTYLRYAEGVDRLSIRGDERSEPKSLPSMVGGGMKAHGVKKLAEKAKETFTGGGDDDDEGGEQGGSHPGVVGALAKGVRRAVGRIAGAVSGDPGEYEDEEHGGRPERQEGGQQKGQGQGQQGRGGEQRRPVKLPGRNR